MKRFLFLVGVLALSTGFLPRAYADQLFSWSQHDSTNAYTLSGTANFATQQDGSAFDLIITVTNTASAGPSVSSDVLTGLYFDINGVSLTALAMLSATATDGFIESTSYTQAAAGTAGSNICAPGVGGTAGSPTCSATVDGGWEAGFWSSGKPDSAITSDNYGIGTSGQSGAFSGTNVNTFDYSLLPLATSASPALVSPNNGLINGNFPFVDSTAVFILSGLGSAQINITNVTAAYGTAPEAAPAATQVNAAPEPSTIYQISAGLLLALLSYCWKGTAVDARPLCKIEDR